MSRVVWLSRVAEDTDNGGMSTRRLPDVSVVVCTRDRPEQLGPALDAVLGSERSDFELIVVDQSESDASAHLVRALAEADARLRYLHDDGVGASRARNIGAALATGEIIAFTDDDCRPEPSWLGNVADAMAGDARAGIAFGTVTPAPCDPAEGYIVGYTPPRRQRLTGRFAKRMDGGIGANMAVRREAFERAGGFDEMLGPGSYFPSCEEGDLAYRVLRDGWALWHLPEARVVHYGLRDWASGSALTRRTYIGVAAAYMKHARRRDIVGAFLVLQSFGMSLAHVLGSVAHRRRPIGLGRLLAHFTGVRRSFELNVDPRSLMYAREDGSPQARSEVGGRTSEPP